MSFRHRYQEEYDMVYLSGIGCILALMLMIVLAYKGVTPIAFSVFVSIIVCIFSGLPIVDTLLKGYAVTTGNFVANYLLLLASGAVLGRIYQDTGAGGSIADSLSKVFGEKRPFLTIMVTCAIMSFSGISGFVLIFAIYPVAIELLKRANISRHLLPAAFTGVCWCAANTAPGSPQLLNVVPSNALGTSTIAGWQSGVPCAVAMFILSYFYLKYAAKKMAAQGITFETDDKENFSFPVTDGKRPPIVLAFIPIVLVAVLYIAVGFSAEKAVLIGDLAAFILMFRYLDLRGWGTAFSEGAHDSIEAVMGTAVIVGFGGVVSATPFYSSIIGFIESSNMNVYLLAAVSTMLLAGLLASATGSASLVMQTLGDVYLGSGADLSLIHRIVAQMACTFDSLPHCGALVAVFSICKTDHKHAYKHLLITSALIPLLCVWLIDVPYALIFG